MASGNGRTAASWFLKKDLVVGVGARDALEAGLIERAGFDFVFSSSLCVSASHGVPDASLLSMTQFLEAGRAMRQAVRIPVLADGDTGYGNEQNVIFAVRQFEEAGIAGMSIEDKQFPKENSLLRGGRHDLASVEEFAAKVEAAVDARRSRQFAVVARVEALVAGAGVEEALRRAYAYQAAGADLILIHSAARSPDEVLGFVGRWDGAAPLVLVPTNYPSLTEKDIRALKNVRMVIYANQPLRAAVRAQEELLAQIRRAGGIHSLGDRLVPVERIFELQGVPQMKKSERKYARMKEGQACPPSA